MKRCVFFITSLMVFAGVHATVNRGWIAKSEAEGFVGHYPIPVEYGIYMVCDDTQDTATIDAVDVQIYQELNGPVMHLGNPVTKRPGGQWSRHVYLGSDFIAHEISGTGAALKRKPVSCRIYYVQVR